MNLGLRFYFCISLTVLVSAEFTDEEYNRLPDLYHFDDYTKCLSQKQGLYCLGSFQLKATEEPNAVYDLMKLYTEDKHHFNRTVIYRGWCVSSRDPRPQDDPKVRFKRCGEDWAQSHNMKAKLQKLEYCKTHEETKTQTDPDLAESIFMYVIYCILAFNIIGTVYDLWKGNSENKIRYIMAWSIPANWSRLTSTFSSQDPRLSCLESFQGARVIVMLIILWAHVFFSHALLYLQNPRTYEAEMYSMKGAIIYNGTSLVQMFVIFSSFLCAYNLLLPSNKKPLSITMFPKQIFKRFIRITPLNLLLVGYGATWWIYNRDGPQWSVLVDKERTSCRQKFWSHALYMNNFYKKDEYCFIQTWFLAVDMQLQVVSLLLTLCLAKYRRHALRILGCLFVLSCVTITLVAYFKNYSPMLHNSLPEMGRVMFSNVPSFYELYINPLNSLPACLMGLFLAHLLYELQESGYKFHENYFLKYSHHFMIPLYVYWLSYGTYLRELTDNVETALFIGFERVFFGLIFVCLLLGYTSIHSPMRRFFSWRGWDVLAKMSLSVMMIHWVVIMNIVAPRHAPTYTSSTNVIIDTASTVLLTYILALPASIMVELPVQRFLDNFIR